MSKPTRRPPLPQHVKGLKARAVELHAQAKADNTRSAYDTDVRQYEGFCDHAGIEPWPATPAGLAMWIGAMSDMYKYATIARKVYGVSSRHRARFDTVCVNDQVKAVLNGLKREKAKGKEKRRKAKALTADIAGTVIANSCGQVDDKNLKHLEEAVDRRGLRDRALLLMGFTGAFRASELAGLDIEDVERDRAGIIVHLSHSKTSSEEKSIGIARWVQNPDDPSTKMDLCPVRSLDNWLEELAAAGIASGRIFRSIDAAGTIATQANNNGDMMSRQTISRIVKDAAARAGYDGHLFSSHSMRRGHITQAYRMGVPEQDIARTSRHKTLSVLRDYEEEANVYQGSASKVRI